MTDTPWKILREVAADEIDTYTVTWRRPGESETQVCRGLDMRTMLARLIGAIRTNGHIEVHAVVRDGSAVIED